MTIGSFSCALKCKLQPVECLTIIGTEGPARSTAVVPFAETAALGQLWLFWLAPLIGAAIGAAIWTVVFSNRSVGIVPPASPTIAGE
jgi:hypothetical protein